MLFCQETFHCGHDRGRRKIRIDDDVAPRTLPRELRSGRKGHRWRFRAQIFVASIRNYSHNFIPGCRVVRLRARQQGLANGIRARQKPADKRLVHKCNAGRCGCVVFHEPAAFDHRNPHGRKVVRTHPSKFRHSLYRTNANAMLPTASVQGDPRGRCGAQHARNRLHFFQQLALKVRPALLSQWGLPIAEKRHGDAMLAHAGIYLH